ncbi:MAG: site-2 protease family protein [Desulfovibrionales bacterium]|nr:site-2 protease family protein [Desulfovibrionales bacterium]
MEETIQRLVILVPAVLLAVTVHEVAHGWVADRLGDKTARLHGRLTFNPIKHLDLVGTVVFFLTQMIGWAKPVPVNPYNFQNPRRDMVWVSLAGPLSNLILAVCSAILYHLLASGFSLGSGGLSTSLAFITEPLLLMSYAAVRINVGLAIFNIIPIPPLDGSKILAGILPASLADSYARIERFGFLILLLLLFTGIIDRLVFPVIRMLTGLLLQSDMVFACC